GRRLEPEEDVAFDGQLRRELRCELRHPRAGGDDELPGVERSGRRRYADTLGRRCPALDRLRETERRAVLLREPKMCLDRTLRRKPSGLMLEHALPAVRPLEERITRAQSGRGEH